MASEVKLTRAPSAGSVWNRLIQRVRSAGSLLLVAALAVAGFWGGHALSPHAEESAAPESVTGPLPREVSLPVPKRQAAGITTEQVQMRDLRQMATVPGMLQYDRMKHVEIKVPVDSVVEQVHVLPGQMVHAGDVLVELSSGAIALARNEVLEAHAQVKLAQTRYTWEQTVYRNVKDLIEAIEENKPVEALESEFAKRTLGEQREALMHAYVELRLAEQIVEQSRQLEAQGALSGRVFQERLGRRQRAAAAFRAALDQVLFDTRQKMAMAEAELLLAKRRQEARQEKLKLLLGPFGTQDDGEEDSLAHYKLRSPFDGTIADLSCAAALRVQVGETLMRVADPGKLWLTARIHQRQWGAVRLQAGEGIEFHVPAFPDRNWKASVKFVGTQVASDGHFLPLVATVDNSDGRLRPGMFAWVDVPLSVGRQALAVPETAIQRHEGKTFVFLEVEPGVYRRVDVRLGMESGGWVAVEGDLKEGDHVVSHGAFFLKSELLLEREEA